MFRICSKIFDSYRCIIHLHFLLVSLAAKQHSCMISLRVTGTWRGGSAMKLECLVDVGGTTFSCNNRDWSICLLHHFSLEPPSGNVTALQPISHFQGDIYVQKFCMVEFKPLNFKIAMWHLPIPNIIFPEEAPTQSPHHHGQTPEPKFGP